MSRISEIDTVTECHCVRPFSRQTLTDPQSQQSPAMRSIVVAMQMWCGHRQVLKTLRACMPRLLNE